MLYRIHREWCPRIFELNWKGCEGFLLFFIFFSLIVYRIQNGIKIDLNGKLFYAEHPYKKADVHTLCSQPGDVGAGKIRQQNQILYEEKSLKCSDSKYNGKTESQQRPALPTRKPREI